MIYEIPNFSKAIASAIENNVENPQVFKGILSTEELEFLRAEQNLCEKVEKRNGIINFKYPKKGVVETFVQNKLSPQLGSFERHGGSYFLTPEPFHVHNDSGKAEEMQERFFPFKNILIPLVSSSEASPFYTVFFKQRSLGEASHFWRGEKFSDQTPLYNHKVTDYGKLLHFTNEPFQDEAHSRHLSHLDVDCLWGLSLESLIHWQEGDVIVFDCSQLHASNNFSKNPSNRKHGLSFFAKKELP